MPKRAKEQEDAGKVLYPVFVPQQHLLKVYDFVLNLENSDTPIVVEVKAPRNTEWTDELIRTMYEQSPRSMKRVLHLLADAPRELTTEDLAKAVGPDATWQHVAGVLGAFGRRVKNRYRMDTWPFQHRWDPDADRAYYAMKPEVASVIKSYDAPLN